MPRRKSRYPLSYYSGTWAWAGAGADIHPYLRVKLLLWMGTPVSLWDNPPFKSNVEVTCGEYIGFTRSPLPQNNGNLPLPFFGGNYSIFFL